MEPGHNQIRSILERILRLKSEQDELGEDIKEVYAEAKSNGFDKTALGQAVSIIRKREKNPQAFAERNEIADLYLSAFDGSASRTHARAREETAPEPDRTPTGAEPEPVPIEEVRTPPFVPPVERKGGPPIVERTKPEMPDIPEFLRKDR